MTALVITNPFLIPAPYCLSNVAVHGRDTQGKPARFDDFYREIIFAVRITPNDHIGSCIGCIDYLRTFKVAASQYWKRAQVIAYEITRFNDLLWRTTECLRDLHIPTLCKVFQVGFDNQTCKWMCFTHRF